METFTMSRKEVPRAGLVSAALAGRISNREGASALHLTPRQFQRLKQRVRAGGARALCHQSRGQPSPRRLPAALALRIQTLLQDRYAGFNDTHLTEKLREVHGLAVSRESVRRLRRALGLPAVHRRRPAMTLLGAIEDATSAVIALHFRPTEDLHGYATLLHQIFTTVGLPVALYGDGVNILVRTDRHWTLEEQLAGVQAPTHLGRVLQDLGIGYVQARSPQGKSRIERLWNTLQDRLVSELRLRQMASRAAANAFLPEFLADFTPRFARPAAAAPAWRRPPRDLDGLLSCRYQRCVARDNTVRLGPRVVQISPGPAGRSYAGRRVEVRELFDGRVLVFAADHLIAETAAPADFTLVPRQAPHRDRSARRLRPSVSPMRTALAELQAALRPPADASARHPAARHPWRVAFQAATRRTHPVRG